MIGRNGMTNQKRRGVTLVELLVVVTLMSILLGIAATAARTGTRGKKQREAARQVNAFFAGARTRAIELNRSVGVEIVNNRPNEPQAGLTLFMVETPPPYAGDLTGAVCQLWDKPVPAPPPPNYGPRSARLAFDIGSSALLTDDNFLQVNDVIFLGYSNQPYRVLAVETITGGYRPVVIGWNIDQPPPLHWITASGSLATPYPESIFKIYRQPQRNSISPLQIPTGVCIDLFFSGLGTTGQELRSQDYTDVVAEESYPKIMFSPNGSIDAFYVQPKSTAATTEIGTLSGLPTGNVNLLIGRYDKVLAVRDAGFDGVTAASAGNSTGAISSLFTSPPDDGTNITDPEAFWVSINRLTGHIATSNNAMVNDPTGMTDNELLAAARRFAKETQTISGR